MNCRVCEGSAFRSITYTQSHGPNVPAFECVECRAILLDEGAATCAEERTSVRRLIARRAHAELEDIFEAAG